MTFHNFTLKIPLAAIHYGPQAKQFQLSLDIVTWEASATDPGHHKIQYDIDKITLHKKRSKRPPRILPRVPDALSERFLRPLIEDGHDSISQIH